MVLFSWKFNYGIDLFKAFYSVLDRIYLNLTVSCFEDLLSKAAVTDKNKILTLILKHAEISLLEFWRKTNIKFFHEFFWLVWSIKQKCLLQEWQSKAEIRSLFCTATYFNSNVYVNIQKLLNIINFSCLLPFALVLLKDVN